jgi:DNA mismatch repair protein MutS
VARAKEILTGLERDELSRGGRPTLSASPGDVRTSQLGLFAPRDNELTQRLQAIDIDDTTPRQALELLAELKKLADDT